MNKAIFFAPFYRQIIEDYKAELYIKGCIDVKKKNHIVRFLPTMFQLKKGVREYIIETYSDLHFTAPDIYEQRVKAAIGTASGFWKADGNLLEYFHVNIYSPTLLRDKLLSPLAPDAKKYYTYVLDSVMGAAHNREYRIRFMPRNRSFQLVGGYLVISDQVWSVREVRFSGRSEMFRFTNLLKMGEVGAEDEFLPVESRVDGNFRFLGNRIEGSYVAMLDYKEIVKRNPAKEKKSEKSKYDLSESYTLRTDANISHQDTLLFETLRPVPLTQRELALYREETLEEDTCWEKKRRIVSWNRVEDALVDYRTLDLNKLGSIRLSPLINPFMFGYSALNGFSYRQEVRYSCLFPHDRLLRVTPSIGYNFRLGEFYWCVESDFDYWPIKRTSLHLEFGNGNRIYSSAIADELRAIPDSIFNFNRIHLDYFKDLYMTVRHSWEITNGLILDVSLSMHRRTDASRAGNVNVFPDTPPVTRAEEGNPPLLPNVGAEVLNSLARVYNSFAPGIRLTWTPGQYYYMHGDRKVNLYSRYPTFSFDWERGISGVLPNSGKHERFELDMQHNVPIGLMRTLYYRLGWGVFTKQQALYFIDFANFRRSALPMGWNDDLGGIFQLLDRRWYNASREYVRGHLTYESPFFLLRHLNKYTQSVLKERLYLGVLWVPHLHPYVEVGYGIGTHLFDFGVFSAFNKWNYKEIGVKITFELFNR